MSQDEKKESCELQTEDSLRDLPQSDHVSDGDSSSQDSPQNEADLSQNDPDSPQKTNRMKLFMENGYVIDLKLSLLETLISSLVWIHTLTSILMFVVAKCFFYEALDSFAQTSGFDLQVFCGVLFSCLFLAVCCTGVILARDFEHNISFMILSSSLVKFFIGDDPKEDSDELFTAENKKLFAQRFMKPYKLEIKSKGEDSS